MHSPAFKDHFSKQSGLYARYRPGYPRELFVFLAGLTAEHGLVWDCGTGNGQAAIALTEFYDRVIATDPSAEQVSNSSPHPKVEYRVEKAEANSIETNSVDLLTIATALHWLDHDLFYPEVNRVLKQDGIIAAWAANTPTVSPEVDTVLNYLHEDILGDYWLAENRMVDSEYATMPFPFQLIDCPRFTSQKPMNLADMNGYLNTWSATQRYITTNGHNPVDMVMDRLAEVWGNADDEKTATWKLTMKVGRKR